MTGKFEYKEISTKLYIVKLFDEIKKSPKAAFLIPKCFNCNELLEKDDLKVLAGKLSTHAVIVLIEHLYDNSKAFSQQNFNTDSEEYIPKKLIDSRKSLVANENLTK